MSGPNDVDRLLHDWDEVASTATPPVRDPRREVRSTSALPVAMLLVAVVAIGAVAIAGRAEQLPATGAASPGASHAATGAPSAQPAATDPGVIALIDTGADDDGRFRLTLASDGTTFHEGETIGAEATVEFLGPEASLDARHGGSPVVFSVEEIGGTRGAGGVNTDPCNGTTYERGEAVAYPWTRSGGYSPDDPSPETQFVMEYLEGWPGAIDGELRLPAGIWRLSATFDVMEEECATDAPSSNLATSVTLRVLPDSAAVSEPPVAASPVPTTPAAELSSLGVFDDGRFRVDLTTSGTTFLEGDTIRAGAEVTFLGPEASVRTGHGSPAISFRVDEVGGLRSVGGGVDAMCVRTTFARDEAVSYPWQRSGSYSLDSPSLNDQFAKTYLDAWPDAQTGELRLPAGTWRLSAEFDVSEGDCGPHDPRTASVVIRVDPATSPPTTNPNDGPVLQTGPVVLCDRVAAADCEHAVALVRETGPPAWTVDGRDAYSEAATVIVADSCAPKVVCDRQYPHDAIVVLVSPTRPDMPSYEVHGVEGFEEVSMGGNAFANDWVRGLIDRAEQLVPIPTGLPRLAAGELVCPAALLEGTLVEHPDWGLAIGQPDGSVTAVTWPFGHSRDDAAGPALVDGTGAVVAVVGDQVSVGGGVGPRGAFGACGPVNSTGRP